MMKTYKCKLCNADFQHAATFGGGRPPVRCEDCRLEGRKVKYPPKKKTVTSHFDDSTEAVV